MLTKDKADNLRRENYKPQINVQENILLYNVHHYIERICCTLKDSVAQIIGANRENVDVSLIYQYLDEKQWKWIVGKSTTITLEVFASGRPVHYSWKLLMPAMIFLSILSYFLMYILFWLNYCKRYR